MWQPGPLSDQLLFRFLFGGPAVPKILRSDFRGTPPSSDKGISEYVAFAELNLDERNLFFVIYQNESTEGLVVPNDILIGRIDNIEQLDVSGYSDFRVDEETRGVIVGGKIFDPQSLAEYAKEHGVLKSLIGGLIQCDTDLLKAAKIAGVTVDDDLIEKVASKPIPPNIQQIISFQMIDRQIMKTHKMHFIYLLIAFGLIMAATFIKIFLLLV
jgi:hypothetical protein